MIISRWNGFEIDSSEGYYAFRKDLESMEEGWDFLIKLLNSPLLWHKVAFDIYSKETHQQNVQPQLSNLLKKGVIEEMEECRCDYCELIYSSSISAFLDICEKFKHYLSKIYLNFCISPLKSLPKEEYRKFRSWFLDQFEDGWEGKLRWRKYCKVEEKDFTLCGNSEVTDMWGSEDAFEGRFEFSLEEPLKYSVNISAVDPSLMVYLLSNLTEEYYLYFVGFERAGLDYSPDNLDVDIRDDPEIWGELLENDEDEE